MATENSPTITIKHIVDAMASPPPAPRLPALPQSVILSLPPGLPLPTSEFSTYRPRIPWKPTCSHIVMSRFYAKGATCDHCKQRPEQGWLYRCVQDREAILRQQMEDGKQVRGHCTDTDGSFTNLFQVAYDEIGAMLLTQVKPAHRGPEERSDKYSFLRKELTAETMKNYSPDQIATILQQREHVFWHLLCYVMSMFLILLRLGKSSRSGAASGDQIEGLQGPRDSACRDPCQGGQPATVDSQRVRRVQVEGLSNVPADDGGSLIPKPRRYRQGRYSRPCCHWMGVWLFQASPYLQPQSHQQLGQSPRALGKMYRAASEILC